MDELHYLLTTVKPSLLLVHPLVLGTAQAAAKKAGLPADRVVVFEHLPNSISTSQLSFQSLVTEGLSKDRSFIEKRLARGESKTKIAFLCSSSGTTGRPKVRELTTGYGVSDSVLDMQAVSIPHYAVVANIIQQAVFGKVNDSSVPWNDQRYPPGCISTGVLPFFREYTPWHENNPLNWL